MKLLSRIFDSFPNRIIVGALLAIVFAAPMAASATDTVKIDAATGVANVTAGDTSYKDSANASYDQVVKVQVTYTSTEKADSGSPAQNMRVKIDVPSKAGGEQTIATTAAADNSNTVTGKVTVHLNRAEARLQYEPGTAVWAHMGADGKVATENLGSAGDVIVSGGVALKDVAAGQSGSVTVLARVVAPGVKVTKESELKGQSDKWATTTNAKPSDTLKYLIGYQNTGNTKESAVAVQDSLPAHMHIVSGTTVLTNTAYPKGKKVSSDDIVKDGIVIGDYGPGANAYVAFEVKLDDASKFACGTTTLRNTGVVQPSGMSKYQAVSVAVVKKDCTATPSAPAYTCNALNVTKLSSREIEAKLDYTAANGAKLKAVTYDFGDSTDPLTTDKTVIRHTYATADTYTVSAKLLFSVNGKDKTVSADNCTSTVMLNTEGGQGGLPSTGPGNVLALFAAASAVGGIAYWLVQARRMQRQ